MLHYLRRKCVLSTSVLTLLIICSTELIRSFDLVVKTKVNNETTKLVPPPITYHQAGIRSNNENNFSLKSDKNNYNIGDRVKAKWEDGKIYPATIVSNNDDSRRNNNNVDVRWDDDWDDDGSIERISVADIAKKITKTTVSPSFYEEVIHRANLATEQLLLGVDTNCVILILSDFNYDTNNNTNNSQIKFQCGRKEDGQQDGKEKNQLQDNPCHSASLCLVRIRLEEPSTDEEFNNTRNNYDSNENKTALLTVYDSPEYMKSENVISAFLNKASYALLSRRSFFVWIGKPKENILNKHETLDEFNVKCKSRARNTINYIKTIALLSLFKKQTQISPVDTVLLMDADTWFTDVAFEHYSKNFTTTTAAAVNNSISSALVVEPEDYFSFSNQVSLFGNQNTVGWSKIIMNGGVLGLRNTTWSQNFASLWWFTRCSDHDQNALWLTFFVDWSSSTYNSIDNDNNNVDDTTIFGYDGELFSDYSFQNKNLLLRHLMREIPNIQKVFFSGQYGGSSNTTYNGGQFQQTGLVDAPLEMPNVMILPSSAATRPDTGKILPAITSDMNKTNPTFICHAKYDWFKSKVHPPHCKGSETCSNGKCLHLEASFLPVRPPHTADDSSTR